MKISQSLLNASAATIAGCENTLDANYINRRGRAALWVDSLFTGAALSATFKRACADREGRFLFCSQSHSRLFSFYCSKYKNSACNRAAINNFEHRNFSAWRAAHLNASAVTEICVCWCQRILFQFRTSQEVIDKNWKAARSSRRPLESVMQPFNPITICCICPIQRVSCFCVNRRRPEEFEPKWRYRKLFSRLLLMRARFH